MTLLRWCSPRQFPNLWFHGWSFTIIDRAAAIPPALPLPLLLQPPVPKIECAVAENAFPVLDLTLEKEKDEGGDGISHSRTICRMEKTRVVMRVHQVAWMALFKFQNDRRIERS